MKKKKKKKIHINKSIDAQNLSNQRIYLINRAESRL